MYNIRFSMYVHIFWGYQIGKTEYIIEKKWVPHRKNGIPHIKNRVPYRKNGGPHRKQKGSHIEKTGSHTEKRGCMFIEQKQDNHTVLFYVKGSVDFWRRKTILWIKIHRMQPGLGNVKPRSHNAADHEQGSGAWEPRSHNTTPLHNALIYIYIYIYIYA